MQLNNWYYAFQRVLVVVHSDIDAICSAKILQSLFKSDHILYSLCSVNTVADLISAVDKHKEDNNKVSDNYNSEISYEHA